MTPKKNKAAVSLGRKGGKASTPAKRAAALAREAKKRQARIDSGGSCARCGVEWAEHRPCR